MKTLWEEATNQIFITRWNEKVHSETQPCVFVFSCWVRSRRAPAPVSPLPPGSTEPGAHRSPIPSSCTVVVHMAQDFPDKESLPPTNAQCWSGSSLLYLHLHKRRPLAYMSLDKDWYDGKDFEVPWEGHLHKRRVVSVTVSPILYRRRQRSLSKEKAKLKFVYLCAHPPLWFFFFPPSGNLSNPSFS